MEESEVSSERSMDGSWGSDRVFIWERFGRGSGSLGWAAIRLNQEQVFHSYSFSSSGNLLP